MKREVKSFFIEDNSLNKGYERDGKLDESTHNVYHKKLHKNMPPVDVIAAYEALYPGTIDKLLEEKLKERSSEILSNNITGAIAIKARAVTGLFNLLSVSIICYAFLSLVHRGMWIQGEIFAAVAFVGLFMISRRGKKENFVKRNFSVNRHLPSDRKVDEEYRGKSNRRRIRTSKTYKNNKNS